MPAPAMARRISSSGELAVAEPGGAEVRIEAPVFGGLSRVARHRLVYDALHDFIARQGVHALAIEAKG